MAASGPTPTMDARREDPFDADWDAAVIDVLVVDDNESFRTSISNVIASDGYRTAQAADGAAALGIIATQQVRCMVLDVNMPNLDGPGLLEKLDVPPPVILLAAAFFDDRVRAQAPKVSCFLMKPVDLDVLLNVIAGLLGPEIRDASAT